MSGDTSEIVVPGQIPFDQLQQAWQFRPYVMQHGDVDVRSEDYGKSYLGQPYIPYQANAYRPYPLGGTIAKVTKALYQRWVYSPASGQVELADNTGDPLQVKYHTDLARELNEPNLLHGYAYSIPGGWRLLDWEGQPVSDPHVIAQVMGALRSSNGTSNGLSGPQDASWGPSEDADWERVHAGLPS